MIADATQQGLLKVDPAPKDFSRVLQKSTLGKL